MAQMKLSTEKKFMDLENRHVVAKGEGGGIGINREFGVRCKLLHLEWIKKMWYIYMKYYTAIKKNEIMPFAAT